MSYYKVSGIKISEKYINTKIAINNAHPIEYENYKTENNIIKVMYILRLLERGDFQINDKFSSIEKIAFILTLKKFYKKTPAFTLEIFYYNTLYFSIIVFILFNVLVFPIINRTLYRSAPLACPVITALSGI